VKAGNILYFSGNSWPRMKLILAEHVPNLALKRRNKLEASSSSSSAKEDDSESEETSSEYIESSDENDQVALIEQKKQQEPAIEVNSILKRKLTVTQARHNSLKKNCHVCKK
jgi:hypothetical protein